MKPVIVVTKRSRLKCVSKWKVGVLMGRRYVRMYTANKDDQLSNIFKGLQNAYST